MAGCKNTFTTKLKKKRIWKIAKPQLILHFLWKDNISSLGYNYFFFLPKIFLLFNNYYSYLTRSLHSTTITLSTPKNNLKINAIKQDQRCLVYRIYLLPGLNTNHLKMTWVIIFLEERGRGIGVIISSQNDQYEPI